MKEEADVIREAVSEYTGSRYEFRNPEPGFPSNWQEVSWVIVSPASAGVSRTAAPLIWKTERGMVFVESIELGNTSDWVEKSYGEKGVSKVRAMELDFENPKTRGEFKKCFPKIYQRISDYERVIDGISTKRAISMKMIHDRYHSIVTFYAAAEIDMRSLDAGAKIKRIKHAIDAIREAISEIDKLEERRAH